MSRNRSHRFGKALVIFRRHGGLLRTGEAMRKGIHPRTLYAMRDEGVVEQLSRGVYRLADLPPLGNPDLIPVAVRVPRGVVCLISALVFHEITTQIPHEVHIAIGRGARYPRLEYPPTHVYRFSGRAYTQGVETHGLDGTPVKIYGPEKTLADCFKYRNKIGMDTAIEAVRLYGERKPVRVSELIRFARVCRVGNVMRPYLESLL
jgi:predicted transcriptional regulator of viral defense system